MLIASLLLTACTERRGDAPPTAAAPAVTVSGETVIETAHVRLVTTLPEGELRRDLPALLEQCVASFIELSPPGAEPVIEVRFYTSETHWREAVQAYARARIGRPLTLGSGLSRAAVTIEGTCFLFDIGGRDALRLAAHEAWHAYAHRAFGRGLPLWLDEALACRAEGFYWDANHQSAILRPSANPTRRDQVRRMTDAGRLGSLEEHLRMDPKTLTDDRRALDEYYARAWLLGLALSEPSMEPRVSLALDRARRGATLGTGDTVARTLGITAAELEATWRHLARTLAD